MRVGSSVSFNHPVGPNLWSRWTEVLDTRATFRKRATWSVGFSHQRDLGTPTLIVIHKGIRTHKDSWGRDVSEGTDLSSLVEKVPLRSVQRVLLRRRSGCFRFRGSSEKTGGRRARGTR